MITPLAIPDVLLIEPRRFVDPRGYFSEFYNPLIAQCGRLPTFIQDNEAFSVDAGTVRGLHFQAPPFEQAKLVRCVQGAILDVAVDLRPASATFGQHVARELSAENGFMLFVPAGFAHGYCTLQSNSLVIYKVDAVYSAAHERGLAWDDTAIGISWPVATGEAVLSAKDLSNPTLAELQSSSDRK